jgi:hypothetical protein
VLDHLERVRAEVAAWEKRTRATAFDDRAARGPSPAPPGRCDGPSGPSPHRGTRPRRALVHFL